MGAWFLYLKWFSCKVYELSKWNTAVFPKGDSGCQGKGQPKLGWLLMDHLLLSACRSWILVTVRPEAVVLRSRWSDKLERAGPASAVQMGLFLSEHARL